MDRRKFAATSLSLSFLIVSQCANATAVAPAPGPSMEVSAFCHGSHPSRSTLKIRKVGSQSYDIVFRDANESFIRRGFSRETSVHFAFYKENPYESLFGNRQPNEMFYGGFHLESPRGEHVSRSVFCDDFESSEIELYCYDGDINSSVVGVSVLGDRLGGRKILKVRSWDNTAVTYAATVSSEPGRVVLSGDGVRLEAVSTLDGEWNGSLEQPNGEVSSLHCYAE